MRALWTECPDCPSCTIFIFQGQSIWEEWQLPGAKYLSNAMWVITPQRRVCGERGS